MCGRVSKSLNNIPASKRNEQVTFQKGDRVMVIDCEPLAEVGTFDYYGESGLCWMSFIDGETLSYEEWQIKRLAE